ncbi:hypothetical protein J2I47_18780 [Fibrella sp. HMF5335]|uniref:Outer membrane protein beta-barrel domain-containing protein n=1 Tax=Fibrella rubiginis TaxID=2817060 RepID=A0A939K7G8_9BACT|nr:hypothetical protein [Fibrella rubiginis]MBO0938605.1 hypothetical protein [Fibrella rubiginis]
MKTSIRAIALMAVSLMATTAAVAQQRYDDNRMDNRYDDSRYNDMRSNDRQMRRDDRRNDDVDQRIDNRRDQRRREERDSQYDNDFRNRNSSRQYNIDDLSKAYDEGFDDGQKSFQKQGKQERRENYKNFTFGIYAGGNSTRFQGETIDTANVSGRLGYQLGFFVRGGGRLYGQIGAEYLTSSSQFYRPGDGKVNGLKDITANVDQQYIHVPAYIGVKVAQSERGISGVRLQVGAELSLPLSQNANIVGITNNGFNNATLNGLANIGFDAGPLFFDFVYHYGFQNVLKDASANTQRRVLGVNVGVKF